MLSLKSILVGLAGALCISTTAAAMWVVVPTENETREGNSGNSFPFSATQMRYQQMYDGSAFNGANGIIEAIAFRVNRGSGGFVNKMLNVEIRLSHTPVTPDTMSLTFADNIGGDETLVYNGALTISGTDVSTPNPFDIVIDIDDLFSYDGASNLLFDIKILSGLETSLFDSVSTSAGAAFVQRVWSTNVNAATGSSGGDRGLVTAFWFPVPPSIDVDIDIKPNSDRNSIRPSSKGPTPVAVFGSDTFDVAEIDVTTLAFGPAGAPPKEKPGPRVVDVDRDGFDDLLLRFRTHDAGIAVGETMACLTGETFDGMLFAGCDSIQTTR
jgi:hypothetical protein